LAGPCRPRNGARAHRVRVRLARYGPGRGQARAPQSGLDPRQARHWLQARVEAHGPPKIRGPVEDRGSIEAHASVEGQASGKARSRARGGARDPRRRACTRPAERGASGGGLLDQLGADACVAQLGADGSRSRLCHARDRRCAEPLLGCSSRALRWRRAHEARLDQISGVRGGRISPHKSHRTGRDADVYFFRTPGAKWSRAATEADIDLAPTWALLRCFVTDTDVDMILIDRRVQGWLEAYALANGESKAWVQSVFHDQKEPRQMAVVRHEPGHVAHMHVRFSSPKARRAGVAAYDRLVAAGLVIPTVQSLSHQVKKGETLSGIARTFGVPVEKIKSLNGLGSNLIRVGQVLTLQHAVDILGARDAVGVPARRLPPTEPDPAPVGARIAAKSPTTEQAPTKQQPARSASVPPTTLPVAPQAPPVAAPLPPKPVPSAS
jgi:LysM repeat protein